MAAGGHGEYRRGGGSCEAAGLGLDHGAEIIPDQRALLLEMGADGNQVVVG